MNPAPLIAHRGESYDAPENTLAELQKIDVGQWKGERWMGQAAPSLPQMLARVPAGKTVYVEIKSSPKTVDALAPLLEASAIDVRIKSFDPAVVWLAKQVLPQRKVLLLLDGPVAAAHAIAAARDVRADGVSVENQPSVTGDWIRELHAAGLRTLVWTVNDPHRCRELIADGVDGVITDRAAWMREQLASPA